MSLPKQLYTIVDGEVQLSDAVSREFEILQQNQGDILSDEEWALLLDDVADESQVTIDRAPKRKGGQDNQSNEDPTGSCHGKRRKNDCCSPNLF